MFASLSHHTVPLAITWWGGGGSRNRSSLAKVVVVVMVRPVWPQPIRQKVEETLPVD